MPLTFDTLSHGEIPIGFFNIESDMFLINHYFVFASDLCQAISEWASAADSISTELEMYIIHEQEDIGDLMGAIKKKTFTGFMGELYKRYPYPDDEDHFKQNPEGFRTRQQVEDIIKDYGGKDKVCIDISKHTETITIGGYKFNHQQFHEVIAYIWRGGMPQWKDDVRPDYVKDMMKSVMASKHWLFMPIEGAETTD